MKFLPAQNKPRFLSRDMYKDYFNYRSDLKFLEWYKIKYSEVISLLRVFRNLSEGDRSKIKLLLNDVENNSVRMNDLAFFYARVRNNFPNNWVEGITENDYDYYSKIIQSSIVVCRTYKDKSRSNIVYSLIKRFFDIPYNVLECIIGFNIRSEKSYKKWMTYIIVAGFGLVVANQAKELVEWGVELWSKLHGKL